MSFARPIAVVGCIAIAFEASGIKIPGNHHVKTLCAVHTGDGCRVWTCRSELFSILRRKHLDTGGPGGETADRVRLEPVGEPRDCEALP
jgi:hypothetical protein